jgi:hypothetical protein
MEEINEADVELLSQIIKKSNNEQQKLLKRILKNSIKTDLSLARAINSTPFTAWLSNESEKFIDQKNRDRLARVAGDPLKFNVYIKGRRVIVTEKMDGENTTMYNDHIHARSVDSTNHPSRNWVKNIWGNICGDIPEGWRVCGENLYAKHSISYHELPSYFMGFSIWNEMNVCLGWDETLEYFQLLNVVPVPILYDGIFDEKKIKKFWDKRNWGTSEGYVIRVADSFPYQDFKKRVAKFVRMGHVQTTKHWMRGQPIEPNTLLKK